MTRQPNGRPRSQSPVCVVDGCDRPPNAKSLCKTHYSRWQKTGTTDEPVKPVRKPCAIDGCERLSEARGWCDLHYRRWQRNGDPLYLDHKEREQLQPPTCSIDGCDQPHVSRSWCAKHYTRWKRHGNPFHVEHQAGPQPCAVDDCDTEAISRGYCPKHYRRWRLHGDPLVGGFVPKAERQPKPETPPVDVPDHLAAYLERRRRRQEGAGGPRKPMVALTPTPTPLGAPSAHRDRLERMQR